MKTRQCSTRFLTMAFVWAQACQPLVEGAGNGSPGSTGASPSANQPQCGVSGTVQSFTGLTELGPLLDGVWEFCGGVSPLSRPEVAGLQIDVTQRKYTFMKRDAEGGLVPMIGFESGGDFTLSVDDNKPGKVGVSFGAPANFSTAAELTASPRTLRFAPSTFVYRRPLGVLASSTCQQNGPVIQYASRDELEKRINGRWFNCGGLSPVGGVNLELNLTEGKYYILVGDETNGFTRKVGFDSSGSLGLRADDAAPNKFRLELGSPLNYKPAVEFSTSPVKMRMNPTVFVLMP